jgi:pilus assembly protein Flp/PilA
MNRLLRLIKKLCGQKEGASLAEYGFLVALLALVVLGVLTLLGQSISSLFSSLATSIQGFAN